MNRLETSAPTGGDFKERLRDIHFRPIAASDWRRLQRFHDRLSDPTIALRFHGAKKHLSEPLAHRFTEMDGRDNVAWVATTGSRGRIVGVGRYFRMGPACAEVAFVIEDKYQHQGIGRRLMERLVQSARDNGITEFVAEVLPGNAPMMRLLEDVGTVKVDYRGGVCEARVRLTSAGG